MPDAEDLVIDANLTIPRRELAFATSRSSGPGGQNVNKVETRVTLTFDVDGSEALDADQKERLRRRLASRITRAGLLRVTSQRHRSQSANRKAAQERFVSLLADALSERPPRRERAVPAGARRRRLEEKRRRARLKELRRPPRLD